MSCYLRHLKSVLDKAGIAVTKENRKAIDRAIHEMVGVLYKDCPATWKSWRRTSRRKYCSSRSSEIPL